MLGYATTAAPGKLRFGPQPYEALIGEVCTAFGTTPDKAIELVDDHYALVMGIFDYRNLVAAKDLLAKNDGDTTKAFADQPHLAMLIKRVVMAQAGQED